MSMSNAKYVWKLKKINNFIMETLLRSILIFLLASSSHQLVFSTQALETLNKSMQAHKAEPATPPERKLFLVSQSTVDESNYEMRTKCMYFNQSKTSWPIWSNARSRTIS